MNQNSPPLQASPSSAHNAKAQFLNYTQLHTTKIQDPTLDLRKTQPQRPIYPPHHLNCNINIVITVSPPPPQAKT